ncbi:MAG TPA: four-helix bundle copper-binding protein [Thermoanaerobaculia bacterium]|nr:four-helix bundle copper-binding protein [Thermoanaerobaculia bacterium]
MDRVRQIFSHHPQPATDAGDEAFGVVAATAECAAVCTACADACLSEDDPTPMRDCIRLDLDCADVCRATGALLARPGRQDAATLKALLDACATACRVCAEECEKHAERMAHCRICAEASKACQRACERMRDEVES